MPLRDRNNNGSAKILLPFFQSSTFMLTFLIAVLCLAIVVLWGGYGYPPGMRDFSGYVIFTLAAPAFTVIFCGLVLSYLLDEEPLPKLQIIYAVFGVILFTSVVVLQMVNLDDYTGSKILIHFGIHVAVLILLGIHLILLCLGYNKYADQEERPYVIRVSRGGLPVYR